MIEACSAAGEAAPPHFQLKSEAAAENQKVSIDFIANSKGVRCKFGNEEANELYSTLGMNEKAGMNEVELKKFMETNIGRLYPDVRDVERKRVILKVDSGPGPRSNEY